MKKSNNLWQRFRLWGQSYRGKELRHLPIAYLIMQFAFATFITTMLPTVLVPATTLYLNTFDKSPPWWWGLLGVWVAAWWVIQIAALVIVLTHGRALGEKLFTPAKKVDRLHFPSRDQHRKRARNKNRV